MKWYVLTLMIALTITSCNDEEPTSAQCDRSIVISHDSYKSANDESDFSIKEVTITGDCMSVTYFYGGGCGEISTDLVAGSPSIQHTGDLYKREVKLSIDDKDNCEALIMKSEEFDISALQVEGNSIIIKLHKWDEDILYEY